MWLWYQHQWYHMTKKYVAHSFSFCDLEWEWCYWYAADASAKSVNWLKMSSCISFRSSWTNKCSGAIDDAISVMWYQHWYHMTKKVTLHLVSINLLDLTRWCHWQCHQCHVMLALVPTASQDLKSHITPCFKCLHEMKKMVPPLM